MSGFLMTGRTIPAVILVGGQGTRMGGVDKPLIALSGQTLLAYVVAALRPQVSQIALATQSNPEPFQSFGLPLLPDSVTGQGPLTGLGSALDWARREHPTASHVAIVAGDTPFLPANLIARLLTANPLIDQCSFAKSKSQIHYSTGVWPILPHVKLEDYLEQDNDRSLRGLAKKIGFNTVEWTDNDDPFFNINTPDDLAKAERRLKRL